MGINLEYNPEDFTLKAYEEMLILAKSRFNFIDYESAQGFENYVLWRHDIDCSVHRALKLAEIEKKHNLKSTYFIHLHNDFYNVFENEISELIKHIISLGHKIGLHFDCQYYNIEKEKELNLFLMREKNILEDFFGQSISVFSFHNTSPFTESCIQWKYADMINTYAQVFKEEVAYCSDSNGYWRFRHLAEVLKDEEITKLQVLTHPVWWTETPANPRDKIDLCINGRSRKVSQRYDKLLATSGRENIR